MGRETLIPQAPPTTAPSSSTNNTVNPPLALPAPPSAAAVAAPPTSLAPGFRFHPTDEELVIYYLKRKVCGKSFRFDAIAEIDIYKSEPWDLSGYSLFPKFTTFFNLCMLKIEFLLLFVSGCVLFGFSTC